MVCYGIFWSGQLICSGIVIKLPDEVSVRHTKRVGENRTEHIPQNRCFECFSAFRNSSIL